MNRSLTVRANLSPRRLPGAALLAVALAALLATCRDDPAGPGRGGPGSVALRPVFSSTVELAGFGLTPDTLRLIVVRPPADTMRTLTVFFNPDSAQIRLGVNVVLRAPVETLTVHLELRGGGFALFSGAAPVEVRAGRPGAPQEIPVSYTGPGSSVASLTIAPRDTVVTFGDSLPFRVTARDAAGAPVTLFYVRWSTSDSSALRMNAAGLARARGPRATLLVRARTPTGVADSTPVTLIPVATLLTLVSGAAQSGIVGVLLAQPLRVRVTAADGLGVKGVPVRFRALGAGGEGGGGGVADSLVVSDTGGYAQTLATLGSVAGPQSFEARVGGLPAVSFGATALAGIVSTAASIVTASATSILSGAIATLTLRTKDAFGNNLTTGGLTVAFAATGGTSTGVISATTDRGDGTYTATFTGLLAGSPLTIGATINGSPVTSSPLPTISVLAGAVAQVLVTPTAATLDALGITQLLTATAKDASGNIIPGPAFVWRSDNPLVALVDVNGVVTAVANGAATITATMRGVSGTATCSVAQIVRSVVVSPASAALSLINLTQQFSAVALDGNGRAVAGQPFAWTSSDPLVATVNGTGLATGLTAGSVTITAATAGVSGMATLSVAQLLTSVVVTPAAATLDALGLRQQFSAVAQDASGKAILGRTFGWSVAPSGVATIDPATGLATALANGVATMTATTGGVTGTATLSIAQIVKSVVVSPATVTLDALGLTRQFSAVALDGNGNVVPGQVFSWAAAPTGFATIDPATGLATAVANGPTTITATTAGVAGTAALTVAQVVRSVVVSPATTTLDALGLTQQFSAVARDGNGNVVPGQVFTWTAASPGVAMIDPATGLATALANGGTTITATTTGVAGTAALTVAQVVRSVVVSPASATLSLLNLILTQQFSAVALDGNARQVAGRTFSWSSSAPLVASIDQTGLATRVGLGSSTIAATTDGVAGTANVMSIL